MSTVLLVILLIISVIMTGLILIQRSEGGALGIGGGGGGGFMSGRAATTSIARMTAILGTVFLVLSLLLSVVFAQEIREQSRLETDGEVESLTAAPDSTDTAIPLEDATSDAPDVSATDTTDPADTDE
jgi:preprotein translocase subunit SecG